MTSMWASISCRCPKNELQEILKEEMGGIQRLPAVMFFDQDSSLEAINLGKNN